MSQARLYLFIVGIVKANSLSSASAYAGAKLATAASKVPGAEMKSEDISPYANPLIEQSRHIACAPS